MLYRYGCAGCCSRCGAGLHVQPGCAQLKNGTSLKSTDSSGIIRDRTALLMSLDSKHEGLSAQCFSLVPARLQAHRYSYVGQNYLADEAATIHSIR
jgi:hypothetical protein